MSIWCRLNPDTLRSPISNFRRKQMTSLYICIKYVLRRLEKETFYWSMLSLDDFKGKCPSHSEFIGSYKFEADRTFTKAGTKSEERQNLEAFVNEMLTNPNKAIGFGPVYK